jgi:hypothetical protein
MLALVPSCFIVCFLRFVKQVNDKGDKRDRDYPGVAYPGDGRGELVVLGDILG